MTRQTKSARAEVWRERLVRFESSGLSVREFCSHEAVSPSNSRTHPPQPSREMVLLGAHDATTTTTTFLEMLGEQPVVLFPASG